MGRKSGYEFILPLCRTHHQYLHNVGVKTFERNMSASLAKLAAETHQRWLRSGFSSEDSAE